MDNLSLFTLLLACATLILAVASFWSIWQTYQFRKKDRHIQIFSQRSDKIQEYVTEIYSIASSGFPRGDEQERRIRKWRLGNILLLKNSMLSETKKVDYTFSVKLEDIINKLLDIIEEHKENPEELSAGEKAGVKIIEQVKQYADQALDIISNTRDALK